MLTFWDNCQKPICDHIWVGIVSFFVDDMISISDRECPCPYSVHVFVQIWKFLHFPSPHIYVDHANKGVSVLRQEEILKYFMLWYVKNYADKMQGVQFPTQLALAWQGDFNWNLLHSYVIAQLVQCNRWTISMTVYLLSNISDEVLLYKNCLFFWLLMKGSLSYDC